MKRLVPVLILGFVCFVLAGCWNDQSRNVLNRFADEGDMADTTSYPLLIDGGTKLVYQRGHM